MYMLYSTARAIVDFSDHPPSRASLLKIVGNTMTTTVAEMLAESYVLAEKSGLGADALHKFIEIMFTGPYIQYSGRMLSGDYHKREEVTSAIFPLVSCLLISLFHGF
jgi:3-hydroxyisobutyrate dehydrogenase-like beta-hydroxyacid dehydrogenase